MSQKQNKKRPTLAAKKNLIVHAYDALLTAQARLYTLARSKGDLTSYEISCKQEALLLDDLMIFSISIRKLLEYTGLRSFANHYKLHYIYLDQNDAIKFLKRHRKSIGFLTLINKLIHASYLEYIDNKRNFAEIFLGPYTEKERWEYVLSPTHHPIEPLIFFAADKASVLISISDLIDQSIVIAEKIISTCADSDIYLELIARGVD